MIGALREQHPSPEQFYSNFAKSATRAHEDMVAFQNLMKDPQSQAILDQAQKSRGESSDGVKVWRVTDHPNWLDVQKEASLKQSPNEPEDGNNDMNAVKEEDYHSVLKKFEENHPTVKASTQDDGSNIIQVLPVTARPKPSQLTTSCADSTSSPIQSQLHTRAQTNPPKPNILHNNHLPEIKNPYSNTQRNCQ